jgi:RNA polymerase sigma-70 factor (ECF subfamily)
MSREQDEGLSSVADLARLGMLFDDCRPRLLAMLQRRLGCSKAAGMEPGDILNEAFLLASRRWEQFDSQQAMAAYPWLYRLTLDCLIAAWRRQHRAGRDRVIPWPDQSSVQLGLGLVHTGTSPTSAAAREELHQQMRQTLDMLKEADREILWLRHYDDLSFAEAGAVLGVSENAATVRYVRALRRLKALWQKLHQL